MSKNAYKKKKELSPGMILVLIALAAVVIYFGATFPRNIVAFTPDDILSYSIKYVADLSTNESGGYKTGTYKLDDQAALGLSVALSGQSYRKQVFGTSNNTIDAEGMVEVNLVSSGGDWFTLRCYSDGTLLICPAGKEFKPYRSGFGFGRNSQELFRDLLEVVTAD